MLGAGLHVVSIWSSAGRTQCESVPHPGNRRLVIRIDFKNESLRKSCNLPKFYGQNLSHSNVMYLKQIIPKSLIVFAGTSTDKYADVHLLKIVPSDNSGP